MKPIEATVTIKVDGYWQRCPICDGRGFVWEGFYSLLPSTATVGCRRCDGEGTICTPPIREWAAGEPETDR